MVVRDNTLHFSLTLLFVMGLLLTAATTTTRSADPDDHIGTHSPQQAKAIIAQRSQNALQALKTRNASRLSAYVHPRRGLRFSPYVCTDKSDLTFTRRQVRNFGRDRKRYNWGAYDGSGEPIRLTWTEYYKKFVYAGDFAGARQITYNTARARGNTINRLHATYPNSIFVEYHLPDPDPERGTNWKSLWLIWQPWQATWYLVGIANDQWTI